MTAINVKYLTKIYKDEYALKNCSLEVKSGEFLVVMGASGCGKTTLLKAVAGVVSPTAGELYVDGMLAENLSQRERDVSLVFQEYVLYPNMTVYENVALPLRDMDEGQKQSVVMPVLQKLGLADAASQRPRTLSGGQQQRAALAKAMVKKSSLILMDEPMSNVPPVQRAEFCRLLAELRRQLPQTTFVYVTHNAGEALTLADRIAVMKDGALSYVCDRKNFLHNFPDVDAMEVFMGECEKRELTWGDETEWCSQNLPLRIADTCRARKGEKLVAVRNNMDEGRWYLFYPDGTAAAGAQDFARFPARLEGDKLTVGGDTVSLGEYADRVLLRRGEVTAAIDCTKLKKAATGNCFRMLLTVTYNDGGTLGVTWQGYPFCFLRRTNLAVGERFYMYCDLDDLVLYRDNVRVTAHYPVDQAHAPAKSLGGGRVKILGKPYPMEGGEGKSVAYFTPSSFVPDQKGSIRVRAVLDEDFLGDRKLVYCIVDGVEGYCCFYAPSDMPCFGKKLRLQLTNKVSLR